MAVEHGFAPSGAPLSTNGNSCRYPRLETASSDNSGWPYHSPMPLKTAILSTDLEMFWRVTPTREHCSVLRQELADVLLDYQTHHLPIS